MKMPDTKPGTNAVPRGILNAVYIIGALAALAAFSFWKVSVFSSIPQQYLGLYADRGQMLFYGVLDKGISFSMPLLSLLSSFSYYHSFSSLKPFLVLCLSGIYLLGYMLGAFRDRLRGIVLVLTMLLMDALGAGLDAEQLVYTFLIFLYLNLETERLSGGGRPAAFISGTALGLTMLVRSPLFAFPFLAAAMQFLDRKSALRERFLRATLFLAASYALLAPWVRLNHALFGQFIPFEQERSSCNLITAVKGSVFTMEGDCRALAGLSRTESVYPWAAKEIGRHPLDYIGGAGKRLWNVFLLFPMLIPLALFGVLLCREKEILLTALLAGYFIFMHCLLSIEPRYFFPLRYLLAVPAAAGIAHVFKRLPSSGKRTPIPLYFLTGLVMLPVLFMEYLILAYPGRAAAPIAAVDRALAAHPDDVWLLRKKASLLLEYGETGKGLSLLKSSLRGYDAGRYAYIVAAREAASPPEPPPELSLDRDLAALKLLRESELGREEAARRTWNALQDSWSREVNLLRGLPYDKDRQVLAEIRRTTYTVVGRHLEPALFYWPAEKRGQLLKRLGQLVPKAAGMVRPDGARPDRREAAAALMELVLKKISPFPAAGTREPLSSVMSLTGDLLNERDYTGLARLSAGPGDFGESELRILLELYENPAGSREFTGAAERLLEMRPGEPAALAVYLSLGGDRGRRMEAALSSLKRKPVNAAIAAEAIFDRGRTDEGLRLADWAAANGDDAETARICALLFQRAGRYDRSLKILDAAIKRHPEDSGLFNDRGVVLRFLNRDEEAGKDFSEAVRLSSSNVSAALNLAALDASRKRRGRGSELHF